MSSEPSGRAICPHGLAYDATQHMGCVVCRRDAGEPSIAPTAQVDEGVQRRATLFIWGGIAALVVVVVVVVVARPMLFTALRESSVAPEAPIRGVPPSERRPASSDMDTQRQTWHEDPSTEEGDVEQAERAEALMRAREAVSIIVYTTTWCPQCARAKRYMDVNQIPYTELDVEASESARTAQHRINPRGSIPTFDIEGQVLIGFSPEALEQRITVAAQAHL